MQARFVTSNIFKNIRLIIICAFAFAIPLFPKTLPWLAGLLVLFFLITGNYKEAFLKIKSTKLSLLFISVYFIYVLGLIHSINLEYGWNDLGMKISLLLFPIILADTVFISSESLKQILRAFVFGCILSSMFLTIRACYLFFAEGKISFLYEDYSNYMHPSYLAMYFNFAIAILLLGSKSVFQLIKIIKIIFLFLLSLSVILLFSKAGILALLLVYLAGFIVLAVAKKRAYYIILFAAITGTVFIAINFFLDKTQNRFTGTEQIIENKNLDKTSSESSTARILIWKTSFQLIKKHFLIGVGTGDVKDELLIAYEQNGITGALSKRLNAHCQFLQTAIALGIAGLIILLLSLAWPFFRAFRQKDWIYVIFLLLIIFNFLFESMLERQDGIMFYAFFNALLFYKLEIKGEYESLN